MHIALFDLKAQYRQLQKEINEAVQEVLKSGEYILGPRVQRLEEKVAQFCGVKFGIGVASGTDALYLSLLSCSIGRGDEVVTTPYTFFATAGAISRSGATPVFADIDSKTFTLDPEKLEAKITGRTKAVIPVHIFGQMAKMDEVLDICRKHNLIVIEDACQAIGSENKGRKAGSLGLAGCFSFFPTKNLGCYGDGGMVVTNNEKFALKIKSLRVHGSKGKFIHDTIGCNSRLDEMQAAILLVKLNHLEEWLDRRSSLAALYSDLLKGVVSIPYVEPGNKHTYSLYNIRSTSRDSLKKCLEENGVSCGIYYPVPLHLQKAFESLGYRRGDLPEAEKASDELLAIPLYPELRPAEIRKIAMVIKAFSHLSLTSHRLNEEW